MPGHARRSNPRVAGAPSGRRGRRLGAYAFGIRGDGAAQARAFLAIHLCALGAIATSILVIGVRDPHAAEIFTAAIFGFVAGILFDRWALRPLVDWTAGRARA